MVIESVFDFIISNHGPKFQDNDEKRRFPSTTAQTIAQ